MSAIAKTILSATRPDGDLCAFLRVDGRETSVYVVQVIGRAHRTKSQPRLVMGHIFRLVDVLRAVDCYRAWSKGLLYLE